MANDPIDVFISSTCYDLAALRAELVQYLTERGIVCRVSEDPESAFFVEPHGDSIVSCLKNVEASRAVPEYAGTLAMRGDRVVRMVFKFEGSIGKGTGSVTMVQASFQNIGMGPALNIRHRIRSGDIVLDEQRTSGVPELSNVGGSYRFRDQPLQLFALFCEYENRFGDGYGLEVPIGPLIDPKSGNPPEERLLVRVGTREQPKWQRVL